jgi:hypothetical protein
MSTSNALFESKMYRLNPLHSIEMLQEIERPGRAGTSLLPAVTFIGNARVKGVLPSGQSFGRKVSFEIPAGNIFEAADLFNAMLATEVAKMNKPRIVR